MFKILLALLFCSTASATNYGFPVGHREAFLGNAGGAVESSPGNVLFNPAGLGFRELDRLNLSVSGSAISVQQFDMSNSQAEAEPEEFQVRPLMATGVYPTSMGTAGIFVATPMMYDIVASSKQTSAGYDMDMLSRIQLRSIQVGAAFASKVSERIAWGVTSGLQLQTQQATVYSTAVQPSTYAMTAYSENSKKISKIFLTPGVMVKVSPIWTIGLSAQFFPLTLSSSGNKTTSVHQSTNPTTITRESASYDPDGNKFEYSVRLGQSFELNDSNKIYADVLYDGESSSRDSDNSLVETPEVWVYCLGWRNSSFGTWEPLVGYQRSDASDTLLDMATAGVSFTNKRSEFILGGFMFKTTPKDSRSSGFSSYGIMFSSNVAY